MDEPLTNIFFKDMNSSFSKYIESWQKAAAHHIENYQQDNATFISGLFPEMAINLPVSDVLNKKQFFYEYFHFF